MKSHWLVQKLITITLIAFLASVVWTYISITSEPDTEQEAEASLTVIPQYQIISGKEVLPYPKGTVFEEGMAAYFYAALPEVTVTPLITLKDLKLGQLEGTIESRVILQAVDDKGRIYWQYTLANYPKQAFTLSQNSSGENDQSSFTAGDIRMDVTSTYGTILQIAGELMFQNGTFEAIVASEVHVQGFVNGSKTEKTAQLNLPLVLQPSSFTLPKAQEAITTVALTANSTYAETTILSRVIENGLQLSIVVILLFVLLVLYFYHRKNQSKTAKNHNRYKEWITEGSVEISDKQQVNILNLEGLVDLAIDLNKRVIYDATKARYYVLTEDLVYQFDPERLKALYDSRQKLGKLLVEQKLITTEQLEMGLYYHKKTGSRLGESLIALGFIDEATLYSTLAAQQRLDYYELETNRDWNTSDWLDIINIQKARAMLILPLGKREDGRLVIACGEIYREGLLHALEDIFGPDIYLVSAKPSAIYQILEKLNAKEKESRALDEDVAEGISATQRLTQKELEEFHSAYQRGNITFELFLKGTGLTLDTQLSKTFEQGDILTWLVGNNQIDSDYPSLLRGLDRAVNSMPLKQRHDKQCPTLLEVLKHANYLTPDTTDRIKQESEDRQIPPEQVIIKNLIASQETIRKISLIQKHLLELLGAH